MVAASSNPHAVISVFSKTVPSKQRVSKEVHEADRVGLRKVHALNRNHLHTPHRYRVRGGSLVPVRDQNIEQNQHKY